MSTIELNRKDLPSFTEVEKWLVGKSKGTKANYLSALTAFMEYTNLNPTQLIDLAEADREKPIRQQGEVESKVKGFYEWLTTEYVLKRRGGIKGKKRIPKRGTSRNLALAYACGIKSFFRENGFSLNVKLPKAAPKKENFKIMLRPPDIKKLLDVATNVRDRAIILGLFQSGMSISDFCSLNYGDIERELKQNTIPLHIHLIRKKEFVEYDTFFGQEAVETLKSYLEERKLDGESLTYNSPLFIKRYTKSNSKSSKIRRINLGLVEAVMKSLALKSGLVSKDRMETADVNPLRPHSLRSSFISILKTAGMNNTAVEYMAGHSLNANDQAYFQVRVEELRNMYKKYVKYISLSPKIDTEKLELLEYESKKKEDVISALIENGKHKDEKIRQLTAQMDRIGEILGKLEFNLDFMNMERLVRYVISNAPNDAELKQYMTKRGVSESVLKRTELDCLVYDKKTETWYYDSEADTYRIAY